MDRAPLLQILTGGLVTGLLQVVLSISYAALIYGGQLSPYLGQGIGFALVGAFIIATFVSLFASLPGTVGSNQDVSVAIFSLISASIVTTMTPGAPLEAVFFTVVTTIALTTLLTGLFFFCLGTFKLGGLVRYLPYPVVGGFLAGSGWLLGPFTDHTLWRPLSLAQIDMADWHVIFGQANTALSVAIGNHQHLRRRHCNARGYIDKWP